MGVRKGDTRSVDYNSYSLWGMLKMLDPFSV